jgi:hypothetical protein
MHVSLRTLAGSNGSSDAPVQPATVLLSNGMLTVQANNSNLTQILNDLAEISGMTINGLDMDSRVSGDLRVFGDYGPGNSRDILAGLLTGSGYNFIMVGSTGDGTPRELLLSSQTNAAPSIGTVTAPPVPSSDRDGHNQAAPETDTSASEVLGPGAISSIPSLNDLGDNDRMQKNLQRLQQMQQHQQKAPQ